MTDFILAPLFGAVANFAVALFVFFRAPRHRLNQVYLGWGSALSLWCLGAGALFVVQGEHAAIVWARILHFGVIWIPATGLHVCLLLGGIELSAPWRRFLTFCYGCTCVLVVAAALNVYIGGVQRVQYGWFATAGPGFWGFSAFMPVATIPAIGALWAKRLQAERHRRRKFTILIAANSLLLITGTHDLAPVLGWTKYPGTSVPIFPWGTYAAGLYGVLMAYGVLHDQILDVRVTLSRYAAYVVRLGFFCSLAVLLLIVASLLGPAGGMPRYALVASLGVILVSAIVTGWIFPKVFGGLGEGLERRLLGDQFEYQEQLLALADTLHRYTDVNSMWQDVAEILSHGMRLSPVHGLLIGPRRFAQPYRSTIPTTHPTKAVLETISLESPLLKLFENRDQPIDVRAVDTRFASATERAAHALADKLGAEYVFPVKSSALVVGFLAVGPKIDTQPITALDIDLLRRLAQRMAWATERTLLAEQASFAQRHELLAMMSRGLAHDLNNLLTPVSTILQMTGRNIASSAPEAALLDAAENSLRTVRNYVEEAIIFAKDLRPRMTEITIDEILSETKAIMDTRAQRRGVIVNISGSPDTFRVDCVLCQRMLGNLLANAIDASKPGQAVLLSGVVDRSRDRVTFSVKDNGAGIPPEHLPHIWQPYFTTKDAGENGERGFGLGLAVAQLLVELHQGVITLQSAVGVGTTATIELPREGADKPVWLPPHYVS